MHVANSDSKARSIVPRFWSEKKTHLLSSVAVSLLQFNVSKWIRCKLTVKSYDPTCNAKKRIQKGAQKSAEPSELYCTSKNDERNPDARDKNNQTFEMCTNSFRRNWFVDISLCRHIVLCTCVRMWAWIADERREEYSSHKMGIEGSCLCISRVLTSQSNVWNNPTHTQNRENKTQKAMLNWVLFRAKHSKKGAKTIVGNIDYVGINSTNHVWLCVRVCSHGGNQWLRIKYRTILWRSGLAFSNARRSHWNIQWRASLHA